VNRFSQENIVSKLMVFLFLRNTQRNIESNPVKNEVTKFSYAAHEPTVWQFTIKLFL